PNIFRQPRPQPAELGEELPVLSTEAFLAFEDLLASKKAIAFLAKTPDGVLEGKLLRRIRQIHGGPYSPRLADARMLRWISLLPAAIDVDRRNMNDPVMPFA